MPEFYNEDEYTNLLSLYNLAKNSKNEKKDILFSIPFIEKAFTKLMGRWDRVKLGTSVFFIRMICGWPQEVMFTNTLEFNDL